MKKANLAFLMLIICFSGIPVGFVCDTRNYTEIKKTNDIPKTAGVSVLWNFTSLDDSSLAYVDMSGDGKYTVIVNKNIYLLNNTGKGTPKYNISVYPNAVSHCAISKNGMYYVVQVIGFTYRNIYLFNTSSKTPMMIYNISASVYCLAISDDGMYIGAGLADRFLLFNRTDTKPMINYTTGSNVKKIALSDDAAFIAVGAGKDLYLFFRTSNTPLWKATLKNIIDILDISSDGTYIAVTDFEYLYLFSKTSSNPLWKYYFDDTTYEVRITPVNNHIFLAECNGYHLFTVNSNKSFWEIITMQYQNWIWAVRYSRITEDEKYIIGSLYCSNHDNLSIISVNDKDFLWNRYNNIENLFTSRLYISSKGDYFLQLYLNPHFVVLNHNDYNFGSTTEEGKGSNNENNELNTEISEPITLIIILTIAGLAGISIVVAIILTRKKNK
ncbi:MAG: hypothetical protein ACP6IY_18500 [Promethearchaeia archaeon]